MADPTLSNPDERYPLDTNGNVELSTVLWFLARGRDRVWASTQADLTSEYFPSSGRVGLVTATDTLYIADGEQWLAVETDTGLSTAVLEATDTFIDAQGNQVSDLSGQTGKTTEEVQDDVGTIFDATLVYDDAAPSMGVATGGIDLTQLATPLSLPGLVGTPVDIGANDLEADGTTLWDESAGELVADIDATLATIDELTIPDTNTAPASNGEFRRDGTDVKVYSGGSVQNLSDVASGAPTDASYLTTAAESGLSNETVVDAYPFAAGDLATDAVDTDELATGAVTTTEILDGTITSTDWETESFQDAVGAMAGPGITYDDPNGQLTSPSNETVIEATNDYTASIADIVWVDTTVNGVDITITAPPPTDAAAFWIDVVSTGGGSNTVTLEDNNGESIVIGNQDYGGANAPYEPVEGEVVGFRSNGTSWRGGY